MQGALRAQDAIDDKGDRGKNGPSGAKEDHQIGWPIIRDQAAHPAADKSGDQNSKKDEAGDQVTKERRFNRALAQIIAHREDEGAIKAKRGEEKQRDDKGF